MIVWCLYWHDEASYRDEILLFEVKQEAIEYALETVNVQQYVKEGDTEENARMSLEGGQYPADGGKYYCGAFFYTLEALAIIKKVDGKWVTPALEHPASLEDTH